MFSGGDYGVVVYGYAVDSNSDKELCEVRQIRWAFTADAHCSAVFVGGFYEVSDDAFDCWVTFVKVPHLS